jgi:hypothetical protein
MLKIGEQTRWGTVGAVGCLNGERYYWFNSPATSKLTVGVSMLPAMMVEVGIPERVIPAPRTAPKGQPAPGLGLSDDHAYHPPPCPGLHDGPCPQTCR